MGNNIAGKGRRGRHQKFQGGRGILRGSHCSSEITVQYQLSKQEPEVMDFLTRNNVCDLFNRYSCRCCDVIPSFFSNEIFEN